MCVYCLIHPFSRGEFVFPIRGDNDLVLITRRFKWLHSISRYLVDFLSTALCRLKFKQGYVDI